MFLLELLVAAEGPLLLAVVLDEDDLEIRVGGLFVDGLDAGHQIPGVVAGGDQDADLARLLDGVVGLVEARGVGDHGDTVHRDPLPLIVGVQGLDGGFQAVELGGDVAGHAGGAGPPVVEHMGDVDDLLGLLGEAEVEVVVLAAVVFAPLAAARLFQQGTLKDAQVADIVVGAEVVDHIIRLEVVEGGVLHFALKGHLVGVDKVRPLLGDGLGHIPQGAGVEDIVVVQKGDVLPFCQGKALVGVARDPLVFGEFLVADPLVLGSPAGHRLAHGGVLAGIHQAELPVLIGLILDRVQQLFQEIQGGIVQRHHDADAGPGGLVLGLADQQVHRGQAAGLEGLAGEPLVIIPLVLHPLADPRHPLPADKAQEHQGREVMDQLLRLAEEVPQGPGEFPAAGTGHRAQGFFQLALVLVGRRNLVALVLGELLVLPAALLGLGQAAAQAVHLALVAPHQGHLIGLGRTEEGRVREAAPPPPIEIPVAALLGQHLCPARQGPVVPRDAQGQHPAARQLLGLGGGALHHHQVVFLRPAGGQNRVLPAPGQIFHRFFRGNVHQAVGLHMEFPQLGGQGALGPAQHQDGPGRKLSRNLAGRLAQPDLLFFFHRFIHD